MVLAAMTEAELLEIDVRVNAAQPGPWRAKGGYIDAPDGSKLAEMVLTGPQSERTAEFVAHARVDVPRLIAEVRRLRGYGEQTRIGLDPKVFP